MNNRGFFLTKGGLKREQLLLKKRITDKTVIYEYYLQKREGSYGY